ncbi:hypothetical protein P170DRAFT_58653 [Aspergillus steynii IBT 23096]|uniref:Uncharacterized protein n=1 Tax=Aspergillus steynii IBT 23096 TaxID=1392250 RepID=A0A2I2FSQ2_9EURO|nr:uncharacterized protein P170DRAFT_58653 [Aspergillus steynii IBT 23096]PLB43636.1 hypothetical protein P170DRAFT_58653 [Aspergillus steynii IBT 23096]
MAVGKDQVAAMVDARLWPTGTQRLLSLPSCLGPRSFFVLILGFLVSPLPLFPFHLVSIHHTQTPSGPTSAPYIKRSPNVQHSQQEKEKNPPDKRKKKKYPMKSTFTIEQPSGLSCLCAYISHPPCTLPDLTFDTPHSPDHRLCQHLPSDRLFIL